MSIPDKLKEVLAEGRGVREVGEGVYSTLPRETEGGHMYDGRAALYDFVVGTRLYNRVMWGDSPGEYEEFARRAFASNSSGPVLDAACGSLLFTAPAYLETSRTVVAFDQSLGMLGRARARLARLAGRVPANVIFLQADARDLPFRPRKFQTVLCMNVLHHLADASALLGALDSVLDSGGRLHLTSLVTNGRLVGDRYLGLLHGSGQIARPRGREELRRLLEDSSGGTLLSFTTRGNMAYASRAAAGRARAA